MKDRTLWIFLLAVLVGLALKRRTLPERPLIEEVTSIITFEDITPEFT